MVEFDQLPPTSRSLILATLALDISNINCRNIFDLALRRGQTINEVWRDICKRTAQPRCTMPHAVLESRYTTAAACPRTAAPAPPPLATPAPPPMTAASVMEFGDLIAITPAAPLPAPVPLPAAEPASKRPPPATVYVPSTPNRWAVMTSAGAFLVLGIAIAIMGSMSRSAQTARLDQPIGFGLANEAVRAAGPKSAASPVTVPEPEGTARRMDTISKSFSKP